MWRLIPKLPAALLLAVVALWSVWALHDRARHQVVRVGLTSPSIALVEGTRDVWALTWPAWREEKGEPVLCAYGPSRARIGERSPVELMLRVEPRDAVELGNKVHADEDGWFEAGDPSNWDTIARLDQSKAKSVEYWLQRAQEVEGQEARLRVFGADDSIVLEGVLVGGAVRDVLALLVGVPFLVWAATRFVRRWLDERRSATITLAV